MMPANQDRYAEERLAALARADKRIDALVRERDEARSKSEKLHRAMQQREGASANRLRAP